MFKHLHYKNKVIMRPSDPYYENIYTDKISTNVCTCHDNTDVYKHLKWSQIYKILNDNFISFQWIMIEKFSWMPLMDIRIMAIFWKIIMKYAHWWTLELLPFQVSRLCHLPPISRRSRLTGNISSAGELLSSLAPTILRLGTSYSVYCVS